MRGASLRLWLCAMQQRPPAGYLPHRHQPLGCHWYHLGGHDEPAPRDDGLPPFTTLYSTGNGPRGSSTKNRHAAPCQRTGSPTLLSTDHHSASVGPPTVCTTIRLADWPEGNYQNSDKDKPTVTYFGKGAVAAGCDTSTVKLINGGNTPIQSFAWFKKFFHLYCASGDCPTGD